MSDWTPFNRKGKLRVVLYTDPWWKRIYARLRGWPLWYQVGSIADDGAVSSPTDGTQQP